VRGEMEAAVQEGGQEAQWREIGLGVVAQEFRIAEDEAFFESNGTRTMRPAEACNWRAMRTRATAGCELFQERGGFQPG